MLARIFGIFCTISISISTISLLVDVNVVSKSYAASPSDTLVMDGIDADGVHHKLPGRFALVIGIDRYVGPRHVDLQDLTSAQNDANSVSEILKQANFTVTLLTKNELDKSLTTDEINSGKGAVIRRNDILSAVSQLATDARSSKDDTGRDPVILVYFAGHGLGDESDDYVLPADFDPFFAEDVRDMGVSVKQILQRLAWAHPALSIVITDSCRSPTPVSLSSIAQPDVVKKLFPGGTSQAGKTDVNVAPGTSKIVYATLKSLSSSGDGENGRFTEEFVSQMRHVLDSIKHLPPSDSSKGSNFSDITGKIVSLMQDDSTKLQIPTEDGTTPDFNFFPIIGDFKQEEKLLKFYLNFAPTAKPVDFYTSIYCGYDNFLRDTSKLSYYGDDASSRHSDAETSLRRMTGGNKPDCRSWNQTLNTVATATLPATITKTNGGGWSQTAAVETLTQSSPTPLSASPPLPPLAPASVAVQTTNPLREDGAGASTQSIAPLTSTLVSDVLKSPAISPESKSEIQNFDPNTPIHDLAITAGRTSITASSAANSPLSATVEAQKFVQIVGLVGSRVKIKTDSGIEGFADGRLLEPSKIVETLDLSFVHGELDSKSTKKLASLLRHVVPTDAAAQYSSNDKADGLAKAQSILSVITKSRLDTTSAGSIYPKISSDKSIPSGIVRLTIAAFGLDKDGRGSPDAVSVSSPTVSVSVATAVQSESTNTPDCLTPTMSLEGSDKGTLAYIQYDGTKEQYTLSARIQRALTASGFNKTSPEKVDTKTLPTVQGQIRRCPQFPATLANAAVSALRTCGLGEYKTVTLPAAICQRVSTPSIEIWLARAPSN